MTIVLPLTKFFETFYVFLYGCNLNNLRLFMYLDFWSILDIVLYFNYYQNPTLYFQLYF